MSITLTPNAVNHFNVLISAQNKTKDQLFVRVTTSPRGIGNVVEGTQGSLVTGLYNVNLTEDKSEQDWVFDAGDGLKIVAEKAHFDHYNGLEIDYTGSGLIFHQPVPVACGIDTSSVSSGCGCGTTPAPVSSCGTRDVSSSCGTCS